MITDNKRVDFGPLFLRDAPDVRKAGGNMSRRDEYEQKAEALLAPIVEGQGFELVDVEYVKEAGNWYLRGYIDKPVELLLTIVKQSAERSVINWMRTILLKTAISWKSVRRVLTDH